jgi:hypothetical protein
MVMLNELAVPAMEVGDGGKIESTAANSMLLLKN